MTQSNAWAAAACGTGESMNQPPPILMSTFKDFEGLSRDLSNGMLFDESTADVVLVVQDTKLAAHRAVLAARSPVFRAMFYGPMIESSAPEVEVSVFAPPTMKLLLRFVYTGSVEDVRLEDMVPLMACADHYGISALRDAIGNHLTDSISPETACTVLALARGYQQEQLVERYLSFILMHAQQVMKTEGFLHLDVTVLLKILEADEARIEEIHLFKALVRWYRHWAKDPEVRNDEKNQAERLFGSIRYGQMTGQQLVTEVRQFAGDIVPQDLYVRALEQVAAPGVASFDEEQDSPHTKQGVRRFPPVGTVRISDPLFLSLHSTTVRKVGHAGWNCTAVFEPSTSRTKFLVERLADPQNGIGIAIFDPERNALRSGSSGFPNPNQWGTDCLVGIYGTGCFFGIITDQVLRWRPGCVVEVAMRAAPGGTLRVAFSAEGAVFAGQVDGMDVEPVTAEGVFSVPQGAKLAVALYSPEDAVTIESVW
mmetsp:Transcript_27432/g.49959  ORF Transcript_27432/g.49959 Transcript_27432/m.49959 type:complete len:482 (-) Transcript_27432:5-1450(-)